MKKPDLEHFLVTNITLVYMNFAVLILNRDLNEVLCADSRNVITFVISHTISSNSSNL
jgi:hypothetical protein